MGRRSDCESGDTHYSHYSTLNLGRGSDFDSGDTHCSTLNLGHGSNFKCGDTHYSTISVLFFPIERARGRNGNIGD